MKSTRKILSLVLALMLVVTSFGSFAFAASEEVKCYNCETKVLPVKVAAVAPTCETAGVEEHYVCPNCGKQIVKETGAEDPANHVLTQNHVWGTTVLTKLPTCQADGYTYQKCDNCDAESVISTIAKVGHTIYKFNDNVLSGDVVDPVTTPATCAATGGTKYFCGYGCGYCFPAGTTIDGHDVGQVIIPMTGAKYADHVWFTAPNVLNLITTKTPTCTEDGETNLYCVVCGLCYDDAATKTTDFYQVGGVVGYYKTIAPKTDHKMVVDETKDQLAATCAADGYENLKCTNKDCDYTEKNVLPALKHGDATDGTSLAYWYATTNSGTKEANTWVGLAYYEPDTRWSKIAGDCETANVYKLTCPLCKEVVYTYEDTVNGHDWDETKTINVKAATCTEKGLVVKTCKTCGDSFEIETETVAHDMGDWTEVTAMTCLADGKRVRVCKNCEYKEEDIEKSPLEHNLKEIIVTEPDCETETNGTCYYVCLNPWCTFKSEVEEIQWTHSAPEEINSTNYTLYIAPTCTTNGKRGYTCTKCDAVIKEEIIPMTAHKFSTDEKDLITKAATCTEAGYTYYACQNLGCTAISKVADIDALGHKYEQTKLAVVKKATCMEAGYGYGTCTNFKNGVSGELCGAVDKVIIDKLDHAFTVEAVKSEATCLEDGYTIYKCAYDCGTLSEKMDIVKAKGAHTYNETPDDTSVAATCTAAGVDYFTCTKCDFVLSVITEMLPHEYEEVPDSVVPATCEKDGYKTEKCKNCDETREVATDEKALGHDYLETPDFAAKTLTITCKREGCEYKEVKDLIVPAYTVAVSADGSSATIAPVNAGQYDLNNMRIIVTMGYELADGTSVSTKVNMRADIGENTLPLISGMGTLKFVQVVVVNEPGTTFTARYGTSGMVKF